MTRPAERADARRNRSRLLAAARQVFAERGIGADIREICERSGIGVATLYRNFATKDDLIAAISAEMMEDVEALVEEAAAETDAETSIARLIEGALDTVEHYHELSRALELMLGEAGKPPHSDAMTERIVSIFTRGQEHGLVRTDLEPLALLEAVGSAALTYLRLREQWPPPIARETVVRMTWVALSPPAPSRG